MKQPIKRKARTIKIDQCGGILLAMQELQNAIDSIKIPKHINTFVTSPKPEVAYENSRN